MIPDFEGQAIVQIFANSTQSEIACFAAEVTNGSTFQQSAAVGTILGFFTLIAIISSVATAIYGQSISEIQIHYAQSLSVLIVFSTFHHIYFSGALSMRWPTILVSFWSNYAWAAGMISIPGMQNSITSSIGASGGRTLADQTAGSETVLQSVGGKVDPRKLYGRSTGLESRDWHMDHAQRHHLLNKRVEGNMTGAFSWHGDLVRPGLPIPGDYSGFAGNLSKEGIPISNAFLTGLASFVTCLTLVAGSIIIFKLVLGCLYHYKVMKTEQLAIFRQKWLRFMLIISLRTCYIAFFMMTYLALSQFSHHGSTRALVVAAVAFGIMFLGMSGVILYTCRCYVLRGKSALEPDCSLLGKSDAVDRLSWYKFHQGSELDDSEKNTTDSTLSWMIRGTKSKDWTISHEDEEFIINHGWLASRFHGSQWWFFTFWVVYEFVRACLYGGASGHALVQVICLLIVEIAACWVVIEMKPYRGQRLNSVMVSLLGLSKVTTLALSSAFDSAFNLRRIPATVVGIIIIIVQALLTIALMISIILSAISTYFSMTRNRLQIKPKKWMPHREKYLSYIIRAAASISSLTFESPSLDMSPDLPDVSYFLVKSVRRMPKIEDDDTAFPSDIMVDPRLPDVSLLHEDTTTMHPYSIESETKLTSVRSRQPSDATITYAHALRAKVRPRAVYSISSWFGRRTSTCQAESDSDAAFVPSNSSSSVDDHYVHSEASPPLALIPGQKSMLPANSNIVISGQQPGSTSVCEISALVDRHIPHRHTIVAGLPLEGQGASRKPRQGHVEELQARKLIR